MRNVRSLSLCAIAILSGIATLSAQSMETKDLAVGKFLVASRGLPDPNFGETVILLIQYGNEGAVGLALNRPTKVPISKVLKDLDSARERSETVFAGGPVDLGQVFALLRSSTTPQEATRIAKDVQLIRTKMSLEKVLAANHDPASVRVYLGYCGWGNGQLEHEVSLGAWHIFDSVSDKIFDANPASLWYRMIALTERQFAD